MSNYRRQWEYVTEFEGDKVSMTLTGMKRKHLQKLSKYIKPSDDGAVNVGFENQIEAFDVFAEILPECIVKFEGLVDADGAAGISLETVIEDVYFINLVSEIIQQVMGSSIMTKGEITAAKKPQGEQQRVLRSAVQMKS